MPTYNVSGPVVDLIDADSPEAAIKILTDRLEAAGFDLHDGTRRFDAFESDVDTHGEPVPETAECHHCHRTVTLVEGRWVDPEATGDDSVWRETCDENHEDRIAAHEPVEAAAFVPALPGDPVLWIVDEHGGTFAFVDEGPARTFAAGEVDRGAVNLVLFRATVPGSVAERGLDAAADWAASNAAPDEHAEYLTGNADDIAEKDAADDAEVWIIETYPGDGSVEWWSNADGWVESRDQATEFTHAERYAFNLPMDGQWVEVTEPSGPRTYTATITPEAAAALADSTPVYVEGAVVVQYDGMRTAGDVGDALIGWLLIDAVQADNPVSVDAKDSRGESHAVEVRPRDVLREHLITEAAGLLDQSPGHVEYVRALTELICRVCGISTDHKSEIRNMIMRRVTD